MDISKTPGCQTITLTLLWRWWHGYSVEPTVPSNILEQYMDVITLEVPRPRSLQRQQNTSVISVCWENFRFTAQCNTVFNAPPGFRNWNKFYTTSHFIRGGEKSYLGFASISTPRALLKELILTSGVLPL